MNELIFNGINLNDYCDYIFFRETEPTPERVYDETEVPARNGLLLIDQKYFRNVQREYTVFILGNARRRYEEFINVINSISDYCVLEDSMFPDIYFVAKVNPIDEYNVTINDNKLRFVLTFNRKPQKFLKSGNEPVEITKNNPQLVNPTRYNSSPLIEFHGTGYVIVNGNAIRVSEGDLGNVKLCDKRYASYNDSNNDRVREYTNGLFNTYDIIEIGEIVLSFKLGILRRHTIENVSFELRGHTAAYDYGYDIFPSKYEFTHDDYDCNVTLIYPRHTRIISDRAAGVYGETWAYGCAITVTCSDDEVYNMYAYVNEEIKNYPDSLDRTWVTVKPSGGADRQLAREKGYLSVNGISGYSTISAGEITGNIIMIDTETGDSYCTFNDRKISLNHLVGFDNDLPQLVPGENDLYLSEYTGTGMRLYIMPRWWKL